MTAIKVDKLDNCVMTFTVTESTEFRFRRWLALALFKLGARVLGCFPTVEYTDETKQ